MKTQQIDSELLKLFNRQIDREIASDIIYRIMASFANQQGYEGMAHFLNSQAHDERKHSVKIQKFLEDRGAMITISTLPKVEIELNMPAIFQQAYQHEVFIRDSIDEILTKAYEIKDSATVEFLQWFVKEQVEEIATLDTILQKMAGADKTALLIIDREMAKR